MSKESPARRELIQQVKELQNRLSEAEETLIAIRTREVDAIVVSGAQGQQVFSLTGAEKPYRALIETMNEGTLNVLPDATIAYSNRRFAEMVGTPLEQTIGSSFNRFLPSSQHSSFNSLLDWNKPEGSKGEFTLLAADGCQVPAQLSVRPLENTSSTEFCMVVTDLTAQEEAEQAHSFLARTVESAQVAIVGASLDKIVVSWNRGAETLYGYTSEEILGRSLLLLMTPERRDETARTFERVARGGTVEIYETERLKKDGSRVEETLTVSPMRDATGAITGASGIARDISERKRAEAALVQSEERYRILTLLSNQIVWTTNPEGMVVQDVPLWREFTGQTEEEIQGWGWQRAIHPDDRQRAAAARSTASKTLSPYEAEYRLRRRDGEYRHIASRGAPVFESDGRLREWIGTCTDITESKQAEHTLQDSKAVERARARELQALLDAVPVAVFVSHDAECRHMTGNRVAYELTRLSPGANPSKSAPENERPPYRIIRDGAEIPPGDLPMQRAAATGTPMLNGHFTMVFEDGSERHIEGNATPLLDAEGRPCGAVGGFLDITERKGAEEELLRARQDWEEIFQAIGQLAMILDPEQNIIAVNRATLRATRMSEPELLGRKCYEVFHATPQSPLNCPFQKMSTSLCTETCEMEVQILDRTCLVSSTPVFDEKHKLVKAIHLATDITDRKRAEEGLRKLNRALKTLSECHEAMVEVQEETALLERICRILVQEGGYRLAWVGYAEQDEARTVRPVARAGIDEGYLASARISWGDNERGRGPTGKAIRLGGTFVARQTSTEPEYEPWRAFALQHGFASSIALSLTLNSHAIGALTLYSVEPDAFDEDELKLLAELANGLASGIRALRTRAEHQRAEDALRRSEAELKEAQRVARLGSWAMDVKTGKVQWSEELYRMLGLDASLPALPYPEHKGIFTPESWARLTTGLYKTVRSGVPYELELETVRADASKGWMLARGEPVRDPDGAITDLRGIALDITERKWAEAALRESQALTTAIVDSTSDLIWSVDSERFGLLTFNCGLQDYFLHRRGISIQIGMCPDDLLPSEELAEEWCGFYRRALAEGPYTTEYEAVGGVTLQLTLNLLRRDGEVFGISIFGKDITERKRAERELRESQATIGAIVDSTPDYIWSVEPETFGLLTFNRAMKEYFLRRSVNLEVGTRPEDVFTDTALVARWRNIYERTLAEGCFREDYDTPTAGSMEVVSNLLKRDGVLFGVSVFARDVTERRRAEAALQESEAAFRTLANAMPQMVWMCLPDGMNVYFNDRWVEYTGLTLEESYGRGWNTPFHPDDKQSAWDAWSHATATGNTYRVESRLRAVDGSYRWFLMRGVPMRDAAGQIVKWFGTCTDIDDLKRSEEARRRATEAVARANAYNRSLIEASLDPLVTIAPDGKITDVNLAAETITGCTRHELTGTDFSNYFTDREKARAGYQRVFKEGMVHDYELEVRHRDGHLTAVLYNASVYRGEDGKIIGAFAAARDISERKRAEDALAESRRRLDLAQKAGRVGSWQWTMSTGEILWTPEAEALYGLSAGSFGREYERWRRAVHPDDLERVERELLSAAQSNTSFDSEFRVLWPDGTVHWLAGRGTIVQTDWGRPQHMVGVNVDLTAGKQAEEEIRQLNAGLERRVTERTAALTAANSELEAFSYSVSHDLRAPLRAIDGFCQALVEDYSDKFDAQGRDNLARVRAASQRMDQLVDGILGLSRIGRSEMQRVRVDLSVVARSIMLDLEATKSQRQVDFIIAPNLIADADPALIRVVLQNLIGNAWKFTSRHDQARIEVGLLEHEGQPVYFVRDDGAGFDMAYAKNLFGAFQRLHTPKEFDGTGIGLATVQRIIHRHGGQVWAQGKIEGGATFFFTLPALR